MTPESVDVWSEIKFATLNSWMQLINVMCERNFSVGADSVPEIQV
jgi:hypothetical protein